MKVKASYAVQRSISSGGPTIFVDVVISYNKNFLSFNVFLVIPNFKITISSSCTINATDFELQLDATSFYIKNLLMPLIYKISYLL